MTDSSERRRIDPLPVLWMDNRPDAIRNFARLLQLEEAPLAIEFAESIDEARRQLEQKPYTAMVFDCKMDDLDTTLNGAEFLVQVNGMDKCLPTYVYSAFGGDPVYRPYIERSYVRRVETKADSFGTPLARQPFFEQLMRDAELYQNLRDVKPEAIAFDRYLEDPETFNDVVSIHWEKHGHWIAREMALLPASWAVVCGEDIVLSSRDLLDYPDEVRLRELGKDTNLVPFAYTAAVLSEERMGTSAGSADWHFVPEIDDSYPTLNIEIEGKGVVGDFDTGCPQTHASDSLVQKGMFDFFRGHTHLGQFYRAFSKTVDVTLGDASGEARTKKIAIQFVADWAGSPFKIINPRREALIGRDVLRAFRIEVVLDSSRRKTRIVHL